MQRMEVIALLFLVLVMSGTGVALNSMFKKDKQ